MVSRIFVLAAALVACATSVLGTCCETPATLSMKGVGYSPVVKNVTVVTVSVFADNFLASAVAATLQADAKKVLDFLATKGDLVSNVFDSTPNLNPKYNYDNGYENRFIEGYQGQNDISFELTEITGAVLDDLQNLGGRVENLYRKEDYNVLVMGQREASKNSVYDAMKGAEATVVATGKTLGDIVSVETQYDEYLQWGGGSRDVVRATSTVVFKIY